MTKYPTRCRILDVTGIYKEGIPLNTPAVSLPHVGKEGLAERDTMGVWIPLDE